MNARPNNWITYITHYYLAPHFGVRMYHYLTRSACPPPRPFRPRQKPPSLPNDFEEREHNRSLLKVQYVVICHVAVRVVDLCRVRAVLPYLLAP